MYSCYSTVFSNQIMSKTRGAILLTSSVLVLKIEMTSSRIEYQFFFCDITIVDINFISCHLSQH